MGWTRQVIGLLASIGALLSLYWSSVRDLVGIWSASEAYHFLYLIIPVALYIIWSRRERLVRITPRLRLWAFIPLVAFAGLWLVSHAAFLAVGEHIALVGMLQSLLMLFLGGRAFWALLFPFLLLWMMVPVGDSIAPQLMALTASLSKGALNLLGAGASTDGTILITESGRYQIVEECSSLPFIIGNLLITLVFANLNYRRFHRQALLVLASIPVAIFANILRIVGVVTITEGTAGGVDLVSDHAMFGWVIFAVVIAAELLVAARYAEKQTPMKELAKLEPRFARRPSSRRVLSISMVAAALVMAGPQFWMSSLTLRPAVADCRTSPVLAVATHPTDWRPQYDDSPDYADQGQIQTPDGVVDIYVAYYRRQAEDRELVGWRNRPYDGRTWRLHEMLPSVGGLAWDMPPPHALRLRDATKDRRHVWAWYWVDGRFTGDPLTAKMWQARAVLGGHDPQGAALLLSVAENFDPGSAEPKLRAALKAVGDPADLMEQVATSACPHREP